MEVEGEEEEIEKSKEERFKYRRGGTEIAGTRRIGRRFNQSIFQPNLGRYKTQ